MQQGPDVLRTSKGRKCKQLHSCSDKSLAVTTECILEDRAEHGAFEQFVSPRFHTRGSRLTCALTRIEADPIALDILQKSKPKVAFARTTRAGGDNNARDDNFDRRRAL